MKSFNTWNLTNNNLHQIFKNNNEFISIKVRGNTWEPITRWLRLDSRIFRETTSRARITLCDIESLAEIYNYRSIRWKPNRFITRKWGAIYLEYVLWCAGMVFTLFPDWWYL